MNKNSDQDAREPKNWRDGSVARFLESASGDPDLSEFDLNFRLQLSKYGDRVKQLRKSNDITQASLSIMTGLTQSRISAIESGTMNEGPTFRTMSRLAKALGASNLTDFEGSAGVGAREERRPVPKKNVATIYEANAVVFEVSVDSKKLQIKEAVEVLFGVKVKAVNTTISKGKTKRFRGRFGTTKNVKSAHMTKVKMAHITLEEGDTINMSTDT